MSGKLYFTSIHNGCDVLKSEMAESFIAIHSISLIYTDSINKADIVVFFCCSFTFERESDSTRIIIDLLKKGKRVIVSGCFLPRFIKKFPNVEFVYLKDLQNYLKTNFCFKDIFQSHNTFCVDSQNTPIICISSGCLGHCTFCSIRQVRGKLKSRTMSDIMQLIDKIDNTNRIKLVAQDVSAYGMDIGSSLPDLLRKIWNKYPNLKIQLGNLNVSILKLYSKSDLDLFKYIDGNINLPVQSASNDILKVMGRDYLIEDFYRLYEALFTQNCKISTDIIAGFPTETEEDHKQNMLFMKNYSFEFAQIFMFDPRPNTRAESMIQIDLKTKERRTIELIAQFLSSFSKNHQCSFNKMKEIQYYNTNLIIK